MIEPHEGFDSPSAMLAPSWRRPPDAATSAERQLRNDLQQAGTNVSAIVEEGKPAEVIARTAKTHGCDLVVTGIARDETLGRFFLGGTVNRLIRMSPMPVLIVKCRPYQMYRNIVVATDFSDASLDALQTASRFFSGQQLSVFHAYEPPLVGLVQDKVQFAQRFRDVAVEECAAFLARYRSLSKTSPPLETWIEHGQPDRLIAEFARDRGVDLVVMGAYGQGALTAMLLGSMATRILRFLPCDALVVRYAASA